MQQLELPTEEQAQNRDALIPQTLRGSVSPWWKTEWGAAMGAALFAFGVSRLVAGLAAWAGIWTLVSGDPTRGKGLLVEGALMWDSAWYWQVTTQGYFAWNPQTGSDLAFCPLYPALLRLGLAALAGLGIHLGDPVYGNYVAVGLAISNLCFFAALVLLWRLVRQDHSARVADRLLLLLAIFPAGLFWSAIYTESLFLLLVVGTFVAMRRGWWAGAAMLAGLAAVTRWAGLVLGAVLLVEYLTQAAPPGAAWRARLRGALRPRGLWLALMPVPFLAFLAYLHGRFGDAFVFLSVEHQGWGHSSALPPVTWWNGLSLLVQSWGTTRPASDEVLYLGGGQRIYQYQDLGFSLLFAGLGAWAAVRRQLRPAEWTWLALGLLFPFSQGSTLGVTRYLLPLWPAFLLAARLLDGRPRLERACLILSTGLLAVTAFLWASGHWMA